MVRGARAPDVVVALDFTPNAVHAPLYTSRRLRWLAPRGGQTRAGWFPGRSRTP